MKAIKFLFIISSLFLALGISSCEIVGESPCLKGKGRIGPDTRVYPSFTGIDIRLPGKVYVYTGATPTLSVETYSNLHSEILSSVEGQNLVIRSQSCLEYSQEEASFKIYLPTLENVEVRSSAEVIVNQVNTGEKLRLNLSGSGTIHYTGSTPKITVLHSGSGDVVLAGETESLETNVSGSGRLQGFALSSQIAKVLLSGSGYQQIWVEKELDATITGSGNVYYQGAPYYISTYTSSRGKLIKTN